MASTVQARRTLAGFFVQEKPPSAAAIATFNRKRIAAGLVALIASTFGADVYQRKVALDAVIASGSPNLASAALPFAAADVGKRIHVQGAGVAGATLVARILTFTDTGHVVLDTNASTSVDGSASDATVGIACWGYTKDQADSAGNFAQGDGAGVPASTIASDIATAKAAAIVDADAHADAAIAALGGGGGPTIVRKTAQTVKGAPTGGTGTEAIDPDLKFPVLNGDVWLFDMFFDTATGESSGGGILARLGGPAGTVVNMLNWEYFAANGEPAVVPTDGLTGGDGIDTHHSVTITPGDLYWFSAAKRALVRVHAMITAGADGDVGLSWSSVGFGLDAKVLSGHIIATKVA